MGAVSRWRWVAPALAVALGLLALGAVLVDLVGPTVLHQAEPGGPVANWLITLAVTLPCTAVGVLLAARRPANPIGWLLLTLLLLTAEPSDVYAILDYRLRHGTLPLGWVAVLFIGGPLVNVLMAILLWLFPDGHWASFSARLRQTVDLDAINSELSSTVHHAFEPAHVSICSADGTGTR